MGYAKNHIPVIPAAEAYERVAQQYDRDQPYYDEVDLRAFTKALPGDLTGVRILDAGGGTGRWATRLAKRGAEVTLADPAPAMLALARKKSPGLATVVAGVDALPFPDGCFDVVVCSFVLGYVDDLGAALAELARVLVPGGLLLLSQSPERKSPIHRVGNRDPFLIDVTFHAAKDFVRALEALGFSAVTFEEITAKKGAALGWVFAGRKP